MLFGAMCNSACRIQDQARHDFECSWLKEHGVTLRQREGEYDFCMLWLVVRLLAARRLEMEYDPTSHERYGWEDRFKRGWQAIEEFSTNRHLWPDATIQHWKYLIQTYLRNFPGFPGPTELLGLICREEINSFGLYPGITGTLPPGQQRKRGQQYGLGCYPRATMLNHSCVPNVGLFAGQEKKKADKNSLTARRTIADAWLSLQTRTLLQTKNALFHTLIW